MFAAWQTITSAHGQSGSGGRIKAIEFLNSRPWRFPWIGFTEKDWFWYFNRLTGLKAYGFVADMEAIKENL